MNTITDTEIKLQGMDALIGRSTGREIYYFNDAGTF